MTVRVSHGKSRQIPPARSNRLTSRLTTMTAVVIGDRHVVAVASRIEQIGDGLVSGGASMALGGSARESHVHVASDGEICAVHREPNLTSSAQRGSLFGELSRRDATSSKSLIASNENARATRRASGRVDGGRP